METVKNTKAGVLSWTPAPACISPTSSETSEDEWEEGEEQDHDFCSQMDENGIIGLPPVDETQKHDDDTECNQASSPASPIQEGLGGCEVQDMPPEELSFILNEHLDDVDVLSTFSDDICILREQRCNEDMANEMKMPREGKKTYLDMAQGERDGAKGEWGLRNGPVNNSKEESEIISECQFFDSPPLIVEADGDCKPQCPTYQASSRPTLPIFTHLCHFTSEEMATAPGITHETVPDLAFTDSPRDSNSLISYESSLHRQQNSENEEQELEVDAISPQPPMSNRQSNVSHECSKTAPKNSYHSPAGRSHPCHDAVPSRTSSHNKPKEDCCHTPRRPKESRKGLPSHWIPDLSKVKPRVSFPKGDYKPPKSRWSSKNPPKSLTPEAPVVFKSPADIVKEVLLNKTDGPQPPLQLNKATSVDGPNGTVPQEFRCQQKAGILLDQLQEDHGKLLTKYAEAANTIDRLRLEAKVNLYSEQPKPAHVMPFGLHVEPSKFMRLDFPQAQKAQPNSVSPQPSGPTTHIRTSSDLCLSASIPKSSECQGSQKVATTLYARADKFLHQLQDFEDLLKNKTPFQLVKGLAQLYQGLDSLEKGYLSAKKEHKVLQQPGAEHSHFDPKRELEEFIYQCGRHMDELRERVDQRTLDVDSAHSLCLQGQKSSPSDDSHSERQHTPLPLDPVEVTKKKAAVLNRNSCDFKETCAEQATGVNQSSTVGITPAPNIRRRKEVSKSYSSSQSSLAEIWTSEKSRAKPLTSIRRVLSQDGIVSPGTDSGFVGSEDSHQIWAAAPGSKSLQRPAEASLAEPQTSQTSPQTRDSLQSYNRRTTMEPSEYFQQAGRRSSQGEGKQRQTDSIRTDSETTRIVSEDIQSDQYEETLPCSSPSSSSAAVRHHHGDSLKSSQSMTCNDQSQAIKAFRPKDIKESPLMKPKEPSTVTHSAKGKLARHRTSSLLRSGEQPLDIGGSNRKKWTMDGDEVEKAVRRAARKRPTHKKQTQPDTSTATEDDNSARRLLVTRSTQTSLAAADSQPAHSSAQVQRMKRDHGECANDDGKTSGVPPCSQCLSRHKCSSEKRDASRLCSCHCHRCHRCGHSDAKTSNEQDCCRDSNAPRISSCKPESPSRAPLCPTPLLLYLQPRPVHVCTNKTGSPSKVSSSKEEDRSRPSPRVVSQRRLDDALQAARKVKVRSKRMVRSLTADLRSLERLSKSCSNSNSD
ncbi:microtubule organization protein AKNA isoform X2 [Phyllopteryx taeniolatus]|uniref:microtubule organization protein AKNA isoform X2 n=1 Tax=Phyllopteryx taeniolatus TaxID=161469 RepID=UPI002AD39207|nr:microtubule organization protein AKNA isoform X2 [Phyllopteryx taeniolatus]